MRKNVRNLFLFCVCSLTASSIYATDSEAQFKLKEKYEFHCNRSSDIRDHIPVLRDLSRECSSVVEIGIRTMVSTWGILLGLTESISENRSYLGVDLSYPPREALELVQNLSEALGVSYTFLKANDMEMDMPVSDLLFIDSLHTYCHLTYELETFSPNIRKYIAMHDTSDPWGNRDDDQYHGDYSEYPAEYDRNKRGLWPAVEDFLSRHPEWTLSKRHLNCHGFTILKRVD